MRLQTTILTALLTLSACRAPGRASTDPNTQKSSANPTSSSGSTNPAQSGVPQVGPKRTVVVARPNHPLSQNEARQYALALINRDRAAEGLAEVVLDETASKAAQRHAHDMAQNGFTAHWGTDGSVPEIRYTEAGGEDLASENAGCFGDAKPRTPTDEGPFDPAEIERFEAAFINETPPNDGHRKNILNPMHNRVGLAFTGAVGSKVACVAHEFIDDYGSYTALPKSAKPGDVIHIEGEIRAPFKFGGIGIARVDLPTPQSPSALLKTGSYAMPEPHISFHTKEYKTPQPVKMNGNRFSIDLTLNAAVLNNATNGVYEVGIFVSKPGGGTQLDPVSLRTIVVK
ncbi:MAG: CAP domain-containing protein [Polyangiaceae bacterium]